MDQLVNILINDDHTVKMEAVWALSNATAIAKPQQFQQMVDRGLIKALVACLQNKDQNITTIAIEGLYNTLKCGQENFYKDGFNQFAILAETNGILDCLEDLQYHKNHTIYDQAVKIIEQFFGDSDEDDVIGMIDAVNNSQDNNKMDDNQNQNNFGGQGGLFNF